MASIWCKVLTYSSEESLPDGAFLQLQKQNRTIFIYLQELTMLGRDLCESAQVDRHHAVVKRQVDKDSRVYSVQDNSSRRGTFLNGVRLLEDESKVLQEGDVLRLGLNSEYSTFIFKMNNRAVSELRNRIPEFEVVYVSDKFDSQETAFESQESDVEIRTAILGDSGSELEIQHSKQSPTDNIGGKQQNNLPVESPLSLKKCDQRNSPTNAKSISVNYRSDVPLQNSVLVFKACDFTGISSSNGEDVVILSDTATISIYSSSDNDVTDVNTDDTGDSEIDLICSARKGKKFKRILKSVLIESSDDDDHHHHQPINSKKRLFTPSPTFLTLKAEFASNVEAPLSPSLLDSTNGTQRDFGLSANTDTLKTSTMTSVIDQSVVHESNIAITPIHQNGNDWECMIIGKNSSPSSAFSVVPYVSPSRKINKLSRKYSQSMLNECNISSATHENYCDGSLENKQLHDYSSSEVNVKEKINHTTEHDINYNEVYNNILTVHPVIAKIPNKETVEQEAVKLAKKPSLDQFEQKLVNSTTKYVPGENGTRAVVTEKLDEKQSKLYDLLIKDSSSTNNLDASAEQTNNNIRLDRGNADKPNLKQSSSVYITHDCPSNSLNGSLKNKHLHDYSSSEVNVKEKINRTTGHDINHNEVYNNTSTVHPVITKIPNIETVEQEAVKLAKKPYLDQFEQKLVNSTTKYVPGENETGAVVTENLNEKQSKLYNLLIKDSRSTNNLDDSRSAEQTNNNIRLHRGNAGEPNLKQSSSVCPTNSLNGSATVVQSTSLGNYTVLRKKTSSSNKVSCDSSGKRKKEMRKNKTKHARTDVDVSKFSSSYRKRWLLNTKKKKKKKSHSVQKK